MKVYEFPEKFDGHCTNRFRDIPDLLQNAPEKTARDRNRIGPQTTIYSCSYLRFLTRELVDMPTKSQHSLQKIQITHIHNNKSASTPSSRHNSKRLEITRKLLTFLLHMGSFLFLGSSILQDRFKTQPLMELGTT